MIATLLAPILPYLLAAAGVLGGLAVAWFHGHSSGVKSQQAVVQAAQAQAQATVAQTQAAVEKADAETSAQAAQNEQRADAAQTTASALPSAQVNTDLAAMGELRKD